jgi:dihydropteroate synthase
MLETVQKLHVPLVLMHMRGTPETMQTQTEYQNVVAEVGTALRRCSSQASASGIPKWLLVVDPGIGFAKDLQGNLLLLKHLSRIRKDADNLPLLLGTSRKGFIGKVAGVDVAQDRDPGTIASCVAALCLDPTKDSCNIVRVHNVKDCVQAFKVMDAIRNS